MRLRKPDETTARGTYAFHGWIVALRPRFMQLARLVPGLVTILITVRAILLAAISLPATTGIIVIGVAVEGYWFPRVAGTISVVWQFASTVGFVAFLWVLVIGKFAATAILKDLTERSGVSFRVPWALITNLSTFSFVVWPVVTSHYGWVVPVVWGLELYAGTRYIAVRKWRLGWSIRRRWPMVWTIIDTTTADPQASFGGGISAFFSQDRSIPRPVFNHPALSWITKWSDYGSITFWIYAPNGTTLQQLEDKQKTIAQQFPFVSWVRLDLSSNEDNSWGRLTFGFSRADSILEGMERAVDIRMGPEPQEADLEEPGMADGEPEETALTAA